MEARYYSKKEEVKAKGQWPHSKVLGSVNLGGCGRGQ